ncbi:MAG: tripartite tricarboxylate transporter substrate binding protein [Limnohabitans sp.]|nr:tripartite tricarboxylate transporter substrate binding protein [Limnohabitans sp.]
MLSSLKYFGRRALCTALAMGCWGAVAWQEASAQAYPSKPLKMIAPYPAGGGVDAVARLVAERLALRIGQPIVVDNKPGAAATIGGDALAKSTPDGYTLMVGSITDYAIAPHVHKALAFDQRKDFAPIVEIGYGTVVLVVNADFAPRSVKELIALAKSKPGELSFASSGIGGLQHLNGEMFKQMAGIDLVHVPYKGTSQLLPDLLAGRVPMAIDSLPAHLPHLKTGKVRILAVASPTRSATLPDIPTMTEAGLPGYVSATNYTLFAPAGTPKSVVALLNKEANAVLQMPDVREKLQAQGIVITGGSVESVERQIPKEMDKWT